MTQHFVGRIYAYQPTGGGRGKRESHRAFDSRMTSVFLGGIYQTTGGNSLLTHSFNTAWAHALNLQVVYAEGRLAGQNGAVVDNNPFPPNDGADYHNTWEAGRRECAGPNRTITHFCMLHDDVVPHANWLDVLMQELAFNSADLVSVVIPHKETTGITSTAIGEPEDEQVFCFNSSIIRRLTMTEVMTLPETFSADDCGYPGKDLLVNTGCWLCDFSKPWRKEVHFEINDRLVRNPATNRWRAEVNPEDWNFSRQLRRQGCKVLATRRVKVDHHGDGAYGNDFAWGSQVFDEFYKDNFGSIPIQGPCKPPAAKEPAYHSQELSDVMGWLTDDEGRLLRALAAGKVVAEIGSYCGRSTIWLARSAEHVHAVDTFDGRATSTPTDTFVLFENNLQRYGVARKVTVHRGLSRNMVGELPDGIGLFFIDGAHDEDSVSLDAGLAASKLSPDGLLVFHDYQSPVDPDVAVVVDSLIAEGATIVARAGTVIALRLNGVLLPQEVV